MGKPMQIVPWYLAVIRHLVVPGTTGNQVIILKAQVEGFLQWLNMMHAQALAVISRAGIRSIAALVADPADMVIPVKNVVALPLPRRRETEAVRSRVFSFPIGRLFRTDLADLMHPPAI